jgi:hypothetical protein
MIKIEGKYFQFLSHTKDFNKYQLGVASLPLTSETWRADYIICHQTFQNAKSENGMLLSGIDPSIFDNINAKVYCGDIHTPQQIGKVTYIGSPYLIHFGDQYIPRLLLLDPQQGIEQSIYFPSIRRHTLTIENPDELLKINLNPNDQVKVRFKLNNKLDWDQRKKEIKQLCLDKQWDLCKIETITTSEITANLQQHTNKTVNRSQKQILEEYCILNKIEQDIQIYGYLLLENNAKI